MGPEPSAGEWTRQERAMAAALRRLHARLRGSACSLYLLTRDNGMLTAAMTVDAPLSFSIPGGFATDDLAWPTVRAYQAGKAMAFAGGNSWAGQGGLPRSSVTLAVPYLVPFSSAACPIQTARQKYGVIVVHWTPPQPIAAPDVEFLQREADRLAAVFEAIGNTRLVVPAIPTFITAEIEVSEASSGPVQAQLCDAAKMAADRGSFLHQLHRLVTELVMAAHVQDILAIARNRVVRPFGGTGFAICLVEGDHLHVAGSAGLSRDGLHELEGKRLADPAPVTDAMNGARAKIFSSESNLEQEDPHADQRERAIGYFPFLQSGIAVGCCVVEFNDPRKPMSASELTLLTLMLDQVGQSFARAKAVEAEHALTMSIQRSLLPRSFPHIPELVITARYFSATNGVDVGGDWYDVVPLPDGRIGFVIGDVEGHNLEAAALMGQLRSGVRAYAAEGHEPSTILERSNRLLVGLETDLYATCCCMVLDTATGVAAVASAGHPGPLVKNASTGVISHMDVPVGPPLGIAAGAAYDQITLQLPPGSVAALFTDGVLDERHLGSAAALARLGRALVSGENDDIEAVADRIIGGSGDGQIFDDDAALILLRYEGTRPREAVEVARIFVERDDLRGVAEVRLFLRDLMERWDYTPALDEMQVLASELVTNALIHAHSRVDLRLRKYSNRIRVEVQDSDPNPPVPTTLLEDEIGNEDAENGRGLLIVEALAHSWGSSPAGRGKITWFEL